MGPRHRASEGRCRDKLQQKPSVSGQKNKQKGPVELAKCGKTRKKKADRAPGSVDALHYSQAHKTITMAHLVLKAGGGMKPH